MYFLQEERLLEKLETNTLLAKVSLVLDSIWFTRLEQRLAILLTMEVSQKQILLIYN